MESVQTAYKLQGRCIIISSIWTVSRIPIDSRHLSLQSLKSGRAPLYLFLSSVLLKDDAPWRIQRSGKIQGPIDYLGLFSPITSFGSAFLSLLSRVKGKQSGSRHASSFINLNPPSIIGNISFIQKYYSRSGPERHGKSIHRKRRAFMMLQKQRSNPEYNKQDLDEHQSRVILASSNSSLSTK
jgi:hypothetical protein